MGDRRTRRAPVPAAIPLTAGAQPAPLTASGSLLDPTADYGNAIAWRKLAWGYYETNGKLEYAIGWRASAMSRLSLYAGEILPGEKEPVRIENGPAVDVVEQLHWAESRIMHDLSIQIDVPGRGYLVGREDPLTGEREWCVYSCEDVRPVKNTRPGDVQYFELRVNGKDWVTLTDALVVVVRDPDPRLHWRDTSAIRSSFTTLREIDLLNREIISSLVSRLASNGIIFIPEEIGFATRPELGDNVDPFVYDLIETARQSIKDPGSAGAAIPIPVKVPAGLIEKFRHMVFSEGLSDRTLVAREKAYGVLADETKLPREIMTGLGDTNHWNATQLEKSAIQMHIAPTAELIVNDLTRGFLYPQLRAERNSLIGPNGGRIVMWYDSSDLTIKPDLSDKAVILRDRNAISDEALRRETGFGEEDAPDNTELRKQLLTDAAEHAQLTFTVIEELTGEPVGPDEPSPAPEQPQEDDPQGETQEPDSGAEPAPGTQDNEGPGQ